MTKIKTESMWRCDICAKTEMGADHAKPAGWTKYFITHANSEKPKSPQDAMLANMIEFDSCRNCAPAVHESRHWKIKLPAILAKLFSNKKEEKASVPAPAVVSIK